MKLKLLIAIGCSLKKNKKKIYRKVKIQRKRNETLD